jgi:prevent-host-death family protein
MQAVDKIISVSDAQQDLEALVLDVAATNHEVVLEVAGEPKAVVIPIEVYRQLKLNSRRAVNDKLHEMAHNANMGAYEADRLAEEAVKWARSHKEI